MSQSESASPPKRFRRGFFVDPDTGSPTRSALFLGCTVLALLATYFLGDSPDLEPAARRALFILVLSVLLWVTEVIPAYSVGILVIALQIALLGDPETGVFAESEKDWEQFVTVLGHPLIWLFFGGFVLAAGMATCGLDRLLAAWLLPRFGERPAAVLLGLMLTTFTLSMFMSNTATTAMMLALLSPLLVTLKDDDNLARALLIGTALAANLGGMGSLIGTPPNAIAVGALAELEPSQNISFLEWLLLGVPPALLSMLFGWQFILRIYPASSQSIQLEIPPDAEPVDDNGWKKSVVTIALLLTVGMWLTSGWHGVPTAAVSFIPIVLLTTTGVLGLGEIRGLSYDVLFLMAGGLALGQMVTQTGLSNWIVGHLPLEGLGQIGLILLLSYTTVLISNFMSNTAAANILIPLGITLATGFESSVAVAIAFGASAAMCLPVATPPNAMVYASGRCDAKDFIKTGLLMGLIVPAIGACWLWLVLPSLLGVGPE
ncbi:MAG: SLC13 family permease [Pseudomonadales bacterium]